MWLLLALLLGVALGISSHIRGSVKDKVEGVIEGVAVVCGTSWLFVAIGLWWWLALILGILLFAAYLLALQALTQRKIGQPS